MDITKDKWEVRKECQITYYVELGNDTGIVSVFTDNPEKTKEVAKLIASAPTLKQQRDDLLEACKEFKFIPDCGGDFCINDDGTWFGETTTQEKCAHIGYCHWAYDNMKRFEAAIAKCEA